jgi:hypothetical protein
MRLDAGFWPALTDGRYWSGVIVGAGIGLLTGAALVEVGALAIGHKAWVSVLGIVLVTVGNVIFQKVRTRDRSVTSRA